ncbi:MAG: RdgB/HAM1 family non-canonical purine NTP pyrophosphatase [Chitinophagales bacterium]|nr:RdgB/HAM1 family non-canonical purine NTP pyrophosphatase [Chitinophagales bacterium]
MKLILATANPNKVKEIQPLLPDEIEVHTLKDIAYSKEISEDHDNIEDNSLQKAMTIWEHTYTTCLSDDTGLFINALDGEPGVYSAMYAGEKRDDKKNIKKVLSNMKGEEERSAYFKTVFTLIIDGEIHQFTGILNGQILESPQGKNGFGYDPIFSHAPGLSLAEIGLEEKDKISHRGIALQKVVEFLRSRGK